jgi:hypothetical protein
MLSDLNCGLLDVISDLVLLGEDSTVAVYGLVWPVSLIV